MLVLSRKIGEKIWIGNDVCVTVVMSERGKLRLGIDAPKGIPIYRDEILPDTHPHSPHYKKPPAGYFYVAPEVAAEAPNGDS